MNRAAAVLVASCAVAAANTEWVRVWPSWTGTTERTLRKLLDCEGFDPMHLVARPERRKAECQARDKASGPGLLCVGSSAVLDEFTPFCAEALAPGTEYLAQAPAMAPDPSIPIASLQGPSVMPGARPRNPPVLVSRRT
mmetsp:Transcript_27342/g.82031  ORF Transcript_27342/g.82031 Transcript_27342/m.82031 type:complete len:139 (-) Transcript_27342:90-506(-)